MPKDKRTLEIITIADKIAGEWMHDALMTNLIGNRGVLCIQRCIRRATIIMEALLLQVIAALDERGSVVVISRPTAVGFTITDETREVYLEVSTMSLSELLGKGGAFSVADLAGDEFQLPNCTLSRRISPRNDPTD